jgi:hypothetical protein
MEKKYDKTIVSVKDMLLQFIRQNKRMFFNERDLQMYRMKERVTILVVKTGMVTRFE